MNLKSFLIASLIIHIIGGVAIYFYYNPITLSSPKPVQMVEENLKKKPTETKLKEPDPIMKTKTSVFKGEKRINQQPSSSSNNQSLTDETLQAEFEQEKPQISDDLDSKKAEEFVAEQQEDLSENKTPFSDVSEEPFRETEESPVELHLEEMKEDSEPSQQAESIPQNMEDFEEVETANPEIAKQNQTQKALVAKNLQESQPFNKMKETSNFSSNISKKIQIQAFHSLKQKMGNPSLTYPDFARRAGMQGTVSILFFVNQQGLVDKIQLESSSGHSNLDNFVIRTLARYEFLTNQETWVRYKMPFILKGEEIERARPRMIQK